MHRPAWRLTNVLTTIADHKLLTMVQFAPFNVATGHSLYIDNFGALMAKAKNEAGTDSVFDVNKIRELIELMQDHELNDCLLYTSPSPRDRTRSRMPSSA